MLTESKENPIDIPILPQPAIKNLRWDDCLYRGGLRSLSELLDELQHMIS